MNRRENPFLKEYREKRRALKALKNIEFKVKKYDELKITEEFNRHHSKYMAKEWCPFHGHTFVDGVCLACDAPEFNPCIHELRK